MLTGREPQRRAVAALLAGAERGQGGALVLRGPQGCGRTALLDEAAQCAGWARVLRCGGIESEAGLPFGALHQALLPLLDNLDGLPAPQAAALRSAFGLDAGAPDRYLVGLAVLGLLRAAAERNPVLLLVDDAQWLDPMSTDSVLFTARRVATERVAILLTAQGNGFPASGVPDSTIESLSDVDSRALLAAAGHELSPTVERRVLDQAGGIPLVLLDLVAALTPGQRTGEEPPPHRLPLANPQMFLRHAASLSPPARELVLVAAAESAGSLSTVLAAARALGLPDDALTEAQQSGVLAVTNRELRFGHPAVAAAIYQAASFPQRRRAHLELAEALAADPDRRAWHDAVASVEPDDRVACALAAAAHGAPHALDALHGLELAATLARDPAACAGHLVAAAENAWQAGFSGYAAGLLDRLDQRAADATTRARAQAVLGVLAHHAGRPHDAHAHFLAGARHAPALAPDLLLMAAQSALAGGDHEAACEAEHLITDAGATRHARAAAWLRAPRGEAPKTWPISVETPARLAPSALLFMAAPGHADPDLVSRLRERGAVASLPAALAAAVADDIAAGRWTRVATDGAAAIALAEQMGQAGVAAECHALLAWVAGARGQERLCEHHAGEVFGTADSADAATAVAHWALGLLALALGRAGTAVAALAKVGHPVIASMSLPDAVEAFLRTGDLAAARAAVERLARVGATDEALVCRCHALVAEDEAAEREFARALADTGLASFHAARTQLLFGEWLRRQRRVREARVELRAAVSTFDEMGTHSWAERARTELCATGESTDHDTWTTLSALRQLTPRELQIIRLAAQGMSNRQIGERLFISPRTVGYHLYKVFPKLGLNSRHQLRDLALPARDG